MRLLPGKVTAQFKNGQFEVYIRCQGCGAPLYAWEIVNGFSGCDYCPIDGRKMGLMGELQPYYPAAFSYGVVRS